MNLCFVKCVTCGEGVWVFDGQPSLRRCVPARFVLVRVGVVALLYVVFTMPTMSFCRRSVFVLVGLCRLCRQCPRGRVKYVDGRMTKAHECVDGADVDAVTLLSTFVRAYVRCPLFPFSDFWCFFCCSLL